MSELEREQPYAYAQVPSNRLERLMSGSDQQAFPISIDMAFMTTDGFRVVDGATTPPNQFEGGRMLPKNECIAVIGAIPEEAQHITAEGGMHVDLSKVEVVAIIASQQAQRIIRTVSSESAIPMFTSEQWQEFRNPGGVVGGLAEM
jgi:hypothetical protein